MFKLIKEKVKAPGKGLVKIVRRLAFFSKFPLYEDQGFVTESVILLGKITPVYNSSEQKVITVDKAARKIVNQVSQI